MAKVKKKKFAKKAKGLGGMWKTAKKQMEEQGDIFGTEIEDGPYIAQLFAAELKESAASWHYVDWQFKILEGESEGELVSRRSGIETEENLVWLMRDFARFGLDPDDIDIEDNDDLEAILAGIVKGKPKCRIVAKTGDSNIQNVYINKVIDMEAEESGDGDDEFEKGDRVDVDIDGTDYPGVIKKIKDDTVTVECDDGDTVTADLGDLTKLDGNGEDDGDTDADDWLGEQAGYRKGKKMFVGKVIAIDKEDKTFVMKTNEGKKVAGDIEDLEKVEPDLEKGDRVSCDVDGTDYEGTIKKIKGDTAIVTFDDGDVETKDLDELTKLEESSDGDSDGDGDDQGELSVGDKVEAEYKGKSLIGTVKKINEEDEEVTVLIKKTKKKITVPVSEITIIG